MNYFPDLQIGLLNGWIPFVIYFTGLIISTAFYSKETRLWLFNNPKIEMTMLFTVIRFFGQLSMMTYIILMIFTPLKRGTPFFFGGVLIFAAGFIMEMNALYAFRKTPVGQPVVTGVYRLSRNPQWVGLFLVLLGSAIATGVWFYFILVLLVGVIYHKQIIDEEKVCLEKFGNSYQVYLTQIPRYLLFH